MASEAQSHEKESSRGSNAAEIIESESTYMPLFVLCLIIKTTIYKEA